MRVGRRFRIWPALAAALLLTGLAAAALGCSGGGAGTAAAETPSPAADGKAKETIVFGDLNWTSSLLQNRIAQYLIEFGYGYPTAAHFGATLPLFQGLRRGDIDVLMEVWLPNMEEPWAAALNDRTAQSLGASLGRDWQSGFVIPAYLQAQYPGLDNIEDLKDPQYIALFATPATGGKARLVNCAVGWACEPITVQQVESYGLAEYVEIVAPGDGAALNADLYGAYERGEPWLGYGSGTNDPSLLLELVRLEEPPYSEACWQTTKACAYEDAQILIGVNSALPRRAPEVAEMLRRYELGAGRYAPAVRWQTENPEAGLAAAARWWLSSHPEIWREWVTPEAAAALSAALETAQEPAGWPE